MSTEEGFAWTPRYCSFSPPLPNIVLKPEKILCPDHTTGSISGSYRRQKSKNFHVTCNRKQGKWQYANFTDRRVPVHGVILYPLKCSQYCQ